MITLKQIGKVESNFKEKEDPFVMRKQVSRIILEIDYTEGLYRLSEVPYIQVIFGFHLSDGYSLKGPVYTGETRGVFASRSPNRPSPLGVTTVKLIGIENNILTVSGLDAVDGTPVYDIKPYASVFDETGEEPPEKEWTFPDPRSEIIRFVRAEDIKACLLKAGTIHGHFCPGLASGVYVSVMAMKKLYSGNGNRTCSDGMEKMIVITETNNCFSDGIQVVTGCTFGNNGLIFYDIGKTAATFLIRGKDTGFRIRMKPDFHTILEEKHPEFSRLFQRVVRERAGTEEDIAAFKIKGREACFGLLSIPFDSLFECKEVKTMLPSYAPIFDNVICYRCREQLMESKAVRKNGEIFCKQCGGSGFSRLTGEGIIQ
ncbi:MAG: tRNA (N6-threonylcarbamoyladenosine(37)-N6)-methyltransferase TrmO [Spirochaetales bacterium]|nr:tRNA (N6-threonylcarbamoyladenosine(37)-N6)-methyltransferase TrmO [Spirochaetales bacterium]